MAVDTGEGFGQVSRTVGTVFRYVLLAATLVGILALGLLLVYVANDAIQPATADPGWHLVVLLTLVLPTLAVGGYLRSRTEDGLRTGLYAVGIPAVGALFGAGASIVFVDLVSPLLWLAYVLAVAVPVAAIVAVDRYVGLPTAVEAVAAVGALAASVLVIPGLVTSLPVIPTPGIVLAATLGLPAAWATARFGGSRDWSRRAGQVAALLVVVTTVVASFVGPLVGVGSIPSVVLWLSAVLPGVLYAVAVLESRGSQAIQRDPRGLWLLGVLVAGVLATTAIPPLIGLAGPDSALDWQLLTSTTVTDPATAGVYPALVGSILILAVVVVVAFPVGVGAAVYLEEYAADGRLTRIVQVNISNLAGVPSVVYGLLGLGVFVRYAGAAPGTILVGGLTLSLLILPIVIIAAQEALRAVPDSMRQASYGMGATQWQTVRNVVLPRAFPGILTGTILAIGRAVGETAPLLVIGAAAVADTPTALSSRVAALPLQIFVWATTFADPAFYSRVIPAAVIVLLVILLTMNSVAIVLRNRYQSQG